MLETYDKGNKKDYTVMMKDNYEQNIFNFDGGDKQQPVVDYLPSNDISDNRKSEYTCTDFLIVFFTLFGVFLFSMSSLYLLCWARVGTHSPLSRSSPYLVRTNVYIPNQGSELFYHYIVNRDSVFPLSLFSEYLSTMSQQYPRLKIYVIVLIDDSIESLRDPTASNIIVKYFEDVGMDYKTEMIDFLKSNTNIDIVFMPLSNYMSITPFKNNFRFFPRKFLLFYARIFNLFQYGGISIDIDYHTKQNSYQETSEMIPTIITRHNDGFTMLEYENIFNCWKKANEDVIITKRLVSFLQQILKVTYRLYGAPFEDTLVIDNPKEVQKPLTKTLTHRNKRDIKKQIIDFNRETPFGINWIYDENTETTSVKVALIEDIDRERLNHLAVNIDTNELNVSTKDWNNFNNDDINYKQVNVTEKSVQREFINKSVNDNFFANQTNKNNIKSDITNLNPMDIPTSNRNKTVTFYNFEIWTGNMVPYKRHKQTKNNGTNMKNIDKDRNTKVQAFLTIDPLGSFMATPLPYHPFLEYMITLAPLLINGTTERLIEDVILTPCFGDINNDNDYCKNLLVL